MPDTDIGSATATDMTNTVTDYEVPSETTDGVQDQKESTWQMTRWDTTPMTIPCSWQICGPQPRKSPT